MMASWAVTCPTSKGGEALIDTRKQGVRWKDAHPSGGEFDCKRDAVKARAEPRDSCGVDARQGEVSLRGSGALDEELHRGIVAYPVEGWEMIEVGMLQRRDREQVLAIEVQDALAGHERFQTGCGGEKLGHD